MSEPLEQRVSELESKLGISDGKRQALEEIVGDLLMALQASEDHSAIRAESSRLLEEYRDTLRSEPGA